MQLFFSAAMCLARISITTEEGENRYLGPEFAAVISLVKLQRKELIEVVPTFKVIDAY